MASAAADPTVFVDGTGRRWEVVAAFEARLRRDGTDPLSAWAAMPGTRVVKSNRVRTVLRLEPAWGDGALYVKRYHIRGLRDRLKVLLFADRARLEWTGLIGLAARGIPAPPPVAVGLLRRAGPWGLPEESCLVLGGIEPSETAAARLEGLWQRGEEHPDLGLYLEALAELVVRLQRAGVDHPDLHLGNLLWDSSGRRLVVIDVHNLRFPLWLSRARRRFQLAKLIESLPGRGKDLSLRRFVEAFHRLAPDLAPDAAALEAEVRRGVAAILRRRLPSRTRRCLLESREFRPLAGAAGSLCARKGKGGYARREATDQALEAILRAFLAVDRAVDGAGEMAGEGVWLSRGPRTRVARIEVDGKRYAVKAYLGRARRARRAWIAAHGLSVRELPTPAGLALVTAWPGLRLPGPVLITALFEDARPLHRELERMRDAGDRAGRRRLLAALAPLLAAFHAAGVAQHDLSAKNLLVRQGGQGWAFAFVDLDEVRFRPALGRERRLENLAQLGHLPPGTVTWGERLRFLRACAPDLAGDRAVLRELGSRIRARMDRYHRRTGLPA